MTDRQTDERLMKNVLTVIKLIKKSKIMVVKCNFYYGVPMLAILQLVAIYIVYS